jgi:hypothetical protein
MDDTRDVEARVVAVLPEYRQAELLSDDGHRFALTESTPGVLLSSIVEGQRFRCLVTVYCPRVLRAELVKDQPK